jgi:hypothetical protein
MATTTTAAKNLAIVEGAMATNAGVAMVQVDGTTVRYQTPNELMKARDYWAKRVAYEAGTKQRVTSLKLSGGW